MLFVDVLVCVLSLSSPQGPRPPSSTGNDSLSPRARVLFADLHELLPRSSRPLTSVAAGDVDADGDLDLFFCGGDSFSGAGQPRICLNDGDGRFRARTVNGPAEVAGGAELVDLDSDADLDCLAGSRTYFNDGAGNFVLDPLPHGLPGYRVVVDLSGDGFPDVAATNRQLMLNDGTGHFVAAPANLPAGPSANRISAGDVDGDLDEDLLLTAGSSPRLYRNDGGAAFTDVSGQLPPVANSGLLLVDVDGDLDLDALGGTALFLNDGSGTFTDASAQLPGPSPAGETVLDADSDGDVDLLFTTQLWRNDGTGTFGSSPVQLPYGGRTSADLDSDGDEDLCSILAGLSDDFSHAFFEIDLLLNDGTGTFALASQWTQELATLSDTDADEVARCGALFDLDGDGDLDVATGKSQASMFDDGHWVLAWHANDGDGRFEDQLEAFPQWWTLPACIAAGDVDADGDGDIVVGGFPNGDGSGGTVTLLSQTAGAFSMSHSSLGRTTDMELADLDGDGDLDVLACSSATVTPGGEGVLLYSGGSFVLDATFPAIAIDAEDVALADVDRDGDLDAFFAATSSRLFLNQLAGWSDASAQLGFATAKDIASGDLNGDLRPDLLVVDGSTARTFANTGSGSFPVGVTVASATAQPTHARLLDLDVDGDVDGLVFRDASPLQARPSVLENRYDRLRPASWWLPRFSLDQAAFGDIDRDGDLDVLTRGRLVSNLSRHVSWRTPAKLGREFSFAVRGPARTPWVLRSSLVKAQTPSAEGLLLLGLPINTLASGTLDWFGRASHAMSVPNDPLLIGVEVYLQATVGSPARFTNRETSVVSGF